MLILTDKGLYCPKGDFFIDPWKPVDKAVITHAHSDHARPGHLSYLCQEDSVKFLQYRISPDINVQGLAYNSPIYINGVKISFHPAGHIPGSAQIRLEYLGEIWVVSGDFKTENDGISTPFEPVKCHHFVTECTFGLPIYQWAPQITIRNKVLKWIEENTRSNRTGILFAYSLGKAQRILSLLPPQNQVFLHGAIYNTQQLFAPELFKHLSFHHVSEVKSKKEFEGALVIAPPSAMNSAWEKRFSNKSKAIASGWMQTRGTRRRMAVDQGFVLSDHADWKGLLQAVKETRAENIYTTHGFKAPFTRYLNENGYNAAELETLWGTEDQD